MENKSNQFSTFTSKSNEKEEIYARPTLELKFNFNNERSNKFVIFMWLHWKMRHSFVCFRLFSMHNENENENKISNWIQNGNIQRQCICSSKRRDNYKIVVPRTHILLYLLLRATLTNCASLNYCYFLTLWDLIDGLIGSFMTCETNRYTIYVCIRKFNAVLCHRHQMHYRRCRCRCCKYHPIDLGVLIWKLTQSDKV